MTYRLVNMILEFILFTILLIMTAYLIKAIRAQRARRVALITGLDRSLAEVSRPRQRQVFITQSGVTTSHILGEATASW
jgi:hypothetical protein